MNPIILLAFLLTIPIFLLLGLRSISQKVARLPSPPRLPFIGNLHQLGPIPHLSLYKLSKEHGPLMLLHLGTVRTLVVSSPKIAEEVIKKHDLAFASRPSIKVANTLSYNQSSLGFAKYGENWKHMRRIGITYLLSSKKVKSFNIDRTEEVSRLIEKVTNAASRGSGVVCLTDILNSYSISMITKVVLGPWISEDKKMLLTKLTHDTVALLSEVCMEDFLPIFKWFDVLMGFEGRVEKHRKTWDALLEEVINDHPNNSKEENGKNITYFIDALLDLQKNSTLGFAPTKNHIKAIILDLITAGTDTTFVTLDWCMTELIRNPRVMSKVKEEVREIVNGEDTVREEHLGQMSYLKAFIKEIFRLHPPSPLLVPRESLQDCQILGYNVPMRTRLIINAWAFGRDESNWEAPEQVKPERFLGDNAKNKSSDFFIMPFGAGSRICPGMNFAKSVLELGIANLLYRFNWSLPSGNTIEEMDMEETGRIVSGRKQKLELVPTAIKVY